MERGWKDSRVNKDKIDKKGREEWNRKDKIGMIM